MGGVWGGLHSHFHVKPNRCVVLCWGWGFDKKDSVKKREGGHKQRWCAHFRSHRTLRGLNGGTQYIFFYIRFILDFSGVCQYIAGLSKPWLGNINFYLLMNYFLGSMLTQNMALSVGQLVTLRQKKNLGHFEARYEVEIRYADCSHKYKIN